jgi:hypothetical protein
LVGNVSQSSHPRSPPPRRAVHRDAPFHAKLTLGPDPRHLRLHRPRHQAPLLFLQPPPPRAHHGRRCVWCYRYFHPRVARGPKSPPIWIFPRPPPAPRPRNGRVPAPSRPLTARISSNHDPAGSAGRDPAPDRPRTRPVERVVPNKLARFARPSPPGAFPVVYPSVSLTTHHLTSHPDSIRLPQQPELLPPLR